MSLIAWYKLDGDATDSSGYSNHGTTLSQNWIAGKIGSALVLDGTNYATLPITLPYYGSISVWYNPDSFFDYNTVWDNSSGSNDWECWIYSTGQLAVRSASTSTLLTYQLPTATTWYHIVFTYEHDGNAKLYVNGVLRATKPTVWTAPGSSVYIGGGNSGNTKGKGKADDFRIYDRVLSEKEVKELSKAKVAHWTFNDSQEPTVNLLAVGSTNRNLDTGYDISGNTTKTDLGGGYYLFQNNGTASSTIRLYCDPSNLISGETYACQISFLENTGTVSFDWCDAAITWEPTDSGPTAKSGTRRGISSRSAYDLTYRFLDIDLGVGTSVILYNAQVEHKTYTTDFTAATRDGIIYDSSEYGNHSTLDPITSPKYTTNSMVGSGSYYFNGTSDLIGGFQNMGSSDSMSVAAWVNPEDTGTWRGVFTTSTASSMFLVEVSGSITFRVPGVDGTYWGSSITIPNGVWSHIAAVYDGSDKIIYINGVEVKRLTIGPGTVSIGIPVLGKSYAAASNWYKGYMGDVRFYNSALTSSDIMELYQQRASLDSNGNLYSSGFIESKPDPIAALGSVPTTIPNISYPRDAVNSRGAVATADGMYGIWQHSATADSISIPYGALNGSFTVEVFVNRPTNGGQYNRIVCRNWVANGWIIGWYGNTKIQFGLGDSSGSQHSGTVDIPISTGSVYIVGTYDSVTGNITCYVYDYVSGSLLGTSAGSIPTASWTPSTTAPIVLGNTVPDSQLVSEFRLWGIARTQADIESDMYQRLTGREPGLLGYWPMSNGNDNTRYDNKHRLSNLGINTSPEFSEVGVVDGLVAWYPLNGNTDDLNATSPALTVHGTPSIVGGITTSAYQLNGTGDYLDSYDTVFHITGPFTVCATFKASNTGIILGTGNAHWVAWMTPVSFSMYTSSGAVVVAQGSDTQDTLWHHAVGVWDGAFIRFYLDGVEHGSTACTSIFDSTPLLRIGASGSGSSQYFSGTIADVRYYNSALTPKDVGVLSNNALFGLSRRKQTEEATYILGRIKET